MQRMPDDERSPIFKKWGYWYWILIVVLAIQLVFYTWLTNFFA